MKHVTFSDKSLLMDDETADALVHYAVLLATHGTADSVDVRAYGADGDSVTATMLLSEGASLMAETASSNLPGPDNTEALAYMRERMARLDAPNRPVEESASVASEFRDYDF